MNLGRRRVPVGVWLRHDNHDLPDVPPPSEAASGLPPHPPPTVCRREQGAENDRDGEQPAFHVDSIRCTGAHGTEKSFRGRRTAVSLYGHVGWGVTRGLLATLFDRFYRGHAADSTHLHPHQANPAQPGSAAGWGWCRGSWRMLTRPACGHGCTCSLLALAGSITSISISLL